jgi:segregation and condensation protein B
MKRLPQVKAESLPAIIESILFVADEPVEMSSLAKALRKPREQVEAALKELEGHYEGRGVRLQRSNGLVQMVSAPESGPYVERYLGSEGKQRLSTAALESLAIIAYRQPVTRASVESIRGVNSDGPIASLIARGLIEEVGRAPGPGRPALMGTTLRFLEHFGLKNPGDLPPLPASSPDQVAMADC